MEEKIVYPELPPDYVFDESFDRIYVRKIVDTEEHRPLVGRVVTSRMPNGFLMSLGDADTAWTYHGDYPTIQDAVNACVARLWLGVWE